ncbi:MAG: hypothetical protein HN357_07495 [Chloroflexi bacterium]|nr:hypothetical protein [Chloroflexota bacterium]MBT4683268.1 hypothetical protein [Chloroflexota bacterium]MBT6358969.1 hypothetical protein [Chloroflexota bacterium]
MKLETAIKFRVAIAFVIVLILLSFVKWPLGLGLAVIWLAIVIWQLIKQIK